MPLTFISVYWLLLLYASRSGLQIRSSTTGAVLRHFRGEQNYAQPRLQRHYIHPCSVMLKPPPPHIPIQNHCRLYTEHTTGWNDKYFQRNANDKGLPGGSRSFSPCNVSGERNVECGIIHLATLCATLKANEP